MLNFNWGLHQTTIFVSNLIIDGFTTSQYKKSGIDPFVANHSAIFPFLGGAYGFHSFGCDLGLNAKLLVTYPVGTLMYNTFALYHNTHLSNSPLFVYWAL